jgi:hypothetical protein
MFDKITNFNVLALTAVGALAGFGLNQIGTNFFQGLISIVVALVIAFIYEKFLPESR